MGMYDNIIYECECPVCGDIVDGFQSKDDECYLDSLPYTKVNNFYSSCSLCGIWIEFDRNEGDMSFKMISPEINKIKNIITKKDMVNNIINDDEFISNYCMYKLMPFKRRTKDV
jgi:hypothetical protein